MRTDALRLAAILFCAVLWVAAVPAGRAFG
jgi:hypothetical protein